MNIAPLLDWIGERELIRIRKEERGQAPPFTLDPILAQYRFCNVRREDDSVTRWINTYIRRQYHNHPQLWFMLCIARQINHPPTLGELIHLDAWPTNGYFAPAQMTEVLDARRKRGEKVYTGAYMIRAETDPNKPWYSWTKQRYIAEIVLGRLWGDRARFLSYFLKRTRRLQDVHNMLMEYTGWGPFMSYQAVVDMRFTPLLSNALDTSSWAAAGPGTLRGLNRLAGRPVKQPLGQEEALIEMSMIYPEIRAAFPQIKIDFSDVPNVLCECDKYLRVKLGEGRPRALYVFGRGQ